MIPLRDSVHASRLPAITYVLVAANVCVFLYQVTFGPALEPFIYTYGFIPERFFRLEQADPWNLDRFYRSSPRCSCTAAWRTCWAT